jgi:hypothetical protein
MASHLSETDTPVLFFYLDITSVDIAAETYLTVGRGRLEPWPFVTGMCDGDNARDSCVAFPALLAEQEP